MYNKLLALFFLFTPLLAFAEEEMPLPPRDQNMWQTFILFGAAILFFYFIMWRPEQQRRKKLEEVRTSLQKGDQVTAMGIVGKVDRIKEETVILEMVDGSKIEFLKAAITDAGPSQG